MESGRSNKLPFDEWKKKYVHVDKSIYHVIEEHHGITPEKLDEWIEASIKTEYMDYLDGVYDED